MAPICLSIGDQAFVGELRGINRPVTARFGPDGALYLVDYGAVRDFGRADPDSMADAPLAVIPHTGVVWKISRTNNNHGHGHDDDDDDHGHGKDDKGKGKNK